MIIILDGDGSVLNKEFERINQGSNNANKIYVVAPWARNTIVNTSFELPNGYVTSNYLMMSLMDIDENLGIWELDITDVAMTQFYGIVKFQIKAHIDGKIISTARGKFKVEEGVDWQLPASPDEVTYAQILDALSRTDERFINKVNSNYTDEENEIEQQIINSSLGLKFVKTVGDETTTFEVREDGCFINGEEILDENKIPYIIRETLGYGYEPKKGKIHFTFQDRETNVFASSTLELKLLLESGVVKICEEVNVPVEGYKIGDKYLELLIENGNKVYVLMTPLFQGYIKSDVNDLQNYYLKNEVYTKKEVRDLISNINKFKTQVVSELPSENIDPLTMYFIARVDSAGNDYYEEYLYIGNRFELIGTTKLDLAGYVTTEALNTALSNYVQTSALANYYTISEIDALIGNINTALETILGV